MADEIYQIPMPENPDNPYRLGRHHETDERSRAYFIQEAAVIKPVDHPSPIPILNQGNVGACTGFAGTRHLAQIYGSADLNKIVLDTQTLSGTDPAQDDQFGLALYHENTVSDGFPGTYPPDDTGSSGLGCMRALKTAKLITSYKWATSLRAFASLLQTNSCMIGMPWFEAFFSPDPNWFIDAVGWDQSQLAGGHEVYVRGIQAWDDQDPSKVVLALDNSWDTSWGDHGSFLMHGSTYVTLRSRIDIKQGIR